MANVDPAGELLRGLVNDPPMDDPPGNDLPAGRDGFPPNVELFSGRHVREYEFIIDAFVWSWVKFRFASGVGLVFSSGAGVSDFIEF